MVLLFQQLTERRMFSSVVALVVFVDTTKTAATKVIMEMNRNRSIEWIQLFFVLFLSLSLSLFQLLILFLFLYTPDLVGGHATVLVNYLVTDQIRI